MLKNIFIRNYEFLIMNYYAQSKAGGGRFERPRCYANT